MRKKMSAERMGRVDRTWRTKEGWQGRGCEVAMLSSQRCAETWDAQGTHVSRQDAGATTRARGRHELRQAKKGEEGEEQKEEPEEEEEEGGEGLSRIALLPSRSARSRSLLVSLNTM